MKQSYVILFFALFLSFSFVGKSQIASFSFKTVTENGTYSPKHVLAVWVEKADGTFIKTLKLRGSARKQWLLTWNTKSAGSTTDATTGSTISSHTSHVVNWNLRDLTGTLVPDGDYKIVAEYTDKHSQGPIITVTFAKNTTYSVQTPANQPYFTNMYFLFDPIATGLEEFTEEDNAINVFPNPGKGFFNLKFDESMLQSGNLSIMDLSGKMVYSQDVKNSEMKNAISVNLSNLPAGVYFLNFKTEGQIVRKKLLIQ